MMSNASDGMKTFIFFAGIIILQCLLPWGSMALWNLIDYQRLDSEEIRQSAREVTLKWKTNLTLTDADGNATERTLRPGTKLDLLGIKYKLPDERILLSYEPEGTYLVELEDGTRGLASVPEAAAGLTVYHEVEGEKRLFTITKVEKRSKPLMKSETKESNYPYAYILNDGEYELPFEPIYWPIQNRTSIFYSRGTTGEVFVNRPVALADDLDELRGETLQTLEDEYEPATSVLVRGKEKIVSMAGTDLFKNDTLSVGLMLVFLNDTLSSYYSTGETKKTTETVANFENLLFDINPNMLKSGVYEPYPWGNIGSRYMPLWAARGINGAIDLVIYILLSIPIILFIRRVVFRIRILPNKFIKWTAALISLLIYKCYIFFFAAISVNMIVIYFISFIVVWALIATYLECDRCPYCHNVDCLDDLGESQHNRQHEVETHKWQEEVKTERRGRTVIHHMRDVRETDHTLREYYTQRYHCRKCGKTITYKDSRIISSHTVRE